MLPSKLIECFGTNNILECIANNRNPIHSMRLVDCLNISDKGFSKAVRKLPRLEMVDISLTRLYEDFIEVLARSFPLLKSLTYYIGWLLEYRESNAIAFVIAKIVSGLCDLDIGGH
ncbi:unnamed protein product [Vicia faba]|uniref:Uncharacterized protein n=1 Tax=Vicia faba TaxID=3906 RepID=A0AAV1B6P6_VICFA|nr:unnamed protein product [Vicia faba]